MGHDYLYECLRRMEAEAEAEGVDDIFERDWFEGVRTQIDGWDGTSIFTMDRQTLFITYVQTTRDQVPLLSEIRRTRDDLLSSPKAGVVRRRLNALAGDTANAIGTLFEIRALVPLIQVPNELVDFQPKFPGEDRRAEALVRVAGQELYVEATIFTKQDPSATTTGAFWFDPGQQQQHEGTALSAKILDKAEQCEAADKPVVVFVAENLVTTGLTLGRDPRAWAISDLARQGGAPSISAVVFSKDVFCGKMEVQRNANAKYPLSEPCAEWLTDRCKNAWLIPRE